ncbi:MAG TPA: hypothetical protein VK610_03060, partial [Rhodothermales bacterium]|nr:hypothetical protein [Rhodothermales bacterium]
GANVVALVGIDLSGWLPTAAAPPPTAAAVALTAAPNPFHVAAAVTLDLDRAQTVRVEVRDALGRHVAVLHDGPLAAGSSGLVLDGASLAPGAYLVRALGEGWSRTVRVTRW